MQATKQLHGIYSKYFMHLTHLLSGTWNRLIVYLGMSERKFCFYARPTEYNQIWIVKPFHHTSTGKNNTLMTALAGEKLKSFRTFLIVYLKVRLGRARIFLHSFHIRSELFTAFWNIKDLILTISDLQQKTRSMQLSDCYCQPVNTTARVKQFSCNWWSLKIHVRAL